MSETTTKKIVVNENDLNRDPISGTPGAHPLGTGAGAATGGVAGAAAGMIVGGPVGSMIGAGVGAIAGGLAGKGAAEVVNPTAEEIYWKEFYGKEPYYEEGRSYEFYAPAYRTGWEGRVRHDGRSFDAAESDLKANYNLATNTDMDATWPVVRPAARAAWDRVDRSWTKKAS